MRSERINDVISVHMSAEEAGYIEELLGQFTIGTILGILRDGDCPDALDGEGSETGIKYGGYDKPHDKAVDDLYDALTDLI